MLLESKDQVSEVAVKFSKRNQLEHEDNFAGGKSGAGALTLCCSERGREGSCSRKLMRAGVLVMYSNCARPRPCGRFSRNFPVIQSKIGNCCDFFS